ncbi:TBC1 domain family member 10A-like [Carassius auratus]|uniref:TBC1 domain family member 10A-like n=1 Tax=Carassius auratus TaxID=7957 RepID=A0A6P6JPB2_CARAU|nr:TBC1 domain family member 10A-like [Carassius auratus]XP_026061706.1 TBC1 domain family member 10A-like [Carassius auratus]
MAEITALTPSPPGMADPPVPAPTSPQPLPSETPIPKSSLYGDRAVMGNPTLQASGKISSSRESTPVKNSGALDSAASVSAAGPPAEVLAAPDGERNGKNDLIDQTERHSEAQEQQMPSSPELNPSPNLYPNVQVSQTSSPVPPVDIPPQFTPPVPISNPAPSSQDLEAQTVPQPESAQNPEPNSPSTEPPCTPSRAEPPAVLVQESSGSWVLPSSYSRPAPDTLSYLESASLMSGTLESLSGLGDDGSSFGSDSEVNGPVKRTDKYGFLGGTQYSEGSEAEIAVAVARQREMKWLDMFRNWDKWVSRRFQKVKMRCRKGIPSSLRSKAWQLLSNSQELLDSNPGKFDELEQEQGDPKWLDIIEKDLHRQFPFHEMFAARGGHGQQDLYRILKAYTVYRPEEGYCQAQAPVAAVLLMHMPAEQAFWCLVQICEKYLPGYYSAGLEAIQLDGEIFFSLLRRVCPMAYRHLKKFKIDPILYMTEWFMCIFSRTLPWSCVLHVWDMFFCEGVKIVFRVGLVLLKQMLGSVDKLRELQGMYETMERLRNIPPESIREEVLVQEVVSLSVTESLIESECRVQVRKWRVSRGELTHQPGRRLHGTRAIFEQKQRAAAISSGGSLSFLASHIPPPGPLRASSSLLSLAGLRKSKMPFHSHNKKGSASGRFGQDFVPLQPLGDETNAVASKPPVPPASNAGASGRPPVPHGPSPLVTASSTTTPPAPTAHASSAQMLQPSPKVVSEQITPTIPSPTANNAPLPPCPETAKTAVEEDGKKKKKTKEDKKREKEEERQKLREKKEKEKTEKEKMKKEKGEKEKKKEKGGKKKDKGGGAEPEEKNGAAAAKDLA